MSAKKPGKTKIARRKPGLVITPPMARPVQDNHPARLIFQEAIAAERAASDHDDAHSGSDLGAPLTVQTDPNLHVAISDSLEAEEGTAPLGDSLSRAPTVDVTERALTPAEAPGARRAAEPAKVMSLLRPGDASEHDVHLGISGAAGHSSGIGELSWDDFERTFKKRLSKSQLKICRVLFEKTYALGVESCLIRTRDLMELSQVMGRTIYYALNELENAGFIARGMIYNTPTKRGQVISFYPNPKIRRGEGERSFHYHDQVD
jgi:hypothetical protein